MPRLMLSDEQWSKLKAIMLQEGIYDKPNLRLEVEGMFYRMRVEGTLGVICRSNLANGVPSTKNLITGR